MLAVSKSEFGATMGQDNEKPPAQNPPIQDQSAQGQPIPDQSIQDQSIAGAPVDQDPHETSLLATTQEQAAADDLLHAAHAVPADMVASVELTLDHLSTTVDLFDVPPFDYGDTGGDTG
jgi:hypothetical protein